MQPRLNKASKNSANSTNSTHLFTFIHYILAEQALQILSWPASLTILALTVLNSDSPDPPVGVPPCPPSSEQIVPVQPQVIGLP